MILSDKDIRKALKNGDVILKGFQERHLQPASYDITLGNKFVFTVDYSIGFVDPVRKIFPKTEEVVIKDKETFVLHPGINVLATSTEFVGSRKYLVQLNGKSSLARLGLMVHNTAGLINPGHFLNITFELSNVNNVPIILHPHMPIAQLTFFELSSPPQDQYKGRYEKQNWDHYAPERKSIKKKKK